MNETFVTVVGNLVDDPKLRTLEAGQDLASFRIASTSRALNAGFPEYDGGIRFAGSLAAMRSSSFADTARAPPSTSRRSPAMRCAASGP